MKLCTLGGLELEGADFARPKPLLLLAYLALEGPQERRHLAELFWPGSGQALSNLGTVLTRLRRIGEGVVEASGARISTPLECDAGRLIDALESGEAERGLALYAGAFLDGVRLNWGAELEEWIYRSREFLAGRVQQALLVVAEGEAAVGDFGAAAERAETAYRLAGAAGAEPGELERIHTLLLAGGSVWSDTVRAEASGFDLSLSGSTGEARGRLLAPGAGSLPHRATSFVGREADLAEVVQLLRQEECRLLTITGVGGIGKTRLALEVTRNLVDLDGYSDGVTFVSLEAVSSPASVANALADALGLVVSGRADPRERVKHYLLHKSAVLVLDNFEHLLEANPLLVDLIEGCRRLKLLVTSRERLNLKQEWVFEIEGLSFPHALPASPERARYFDAVQLFVQRAGRARRRFTLDTESLPAILEICRSVEGMPLAIELAAGWLRVLAPQDIARELESGIDLLAVSAQDAPARQRSVRAVFDASWRLLDEREKAVMRRLAVFRGGFSREAASRVAGATLSGLAALVDKSLLQRTPGGRYHLHPLLRQYAGEQLAERPEAQVQARDGHLDYFLDLAEAAEPELAGARPDGWLDRLEREHDNVRAALSWATDRGEAERGLMLAAAVTRFWLVRGHLREGRTRLENLLELPRRGAAEARSKALNALGYILPQMGAWPSARDVLEESLGLAREVEDAGQVATSHRNLGWVALQLNDADAATFHSQRALALNRELGNLRGMAVSLNNLGWIAMFQGRFQEARSVFEESLALRRRVGNPRGIGFASTNLAWAKRHLGEYDGARPLAREGETINRQLGDEQLLGYSCCLLGTMAFDEGDLGEALELLEEGIDHFRRTASGFGLKRYLKNLAEVLRERGERVRAGELLGEMLTICREGQDRYFFATARLRQAALEFDRGDGERGKRFVTEGLSIKAEIGDQYGVVQGLEAAAHALTMDGERLLAARLLSAADALRERIAAPLPPIRLPGRERLLEDLRGDLGEAAFAAAWGGGREWAPGAAARVALATLGA